MKTVAIQAEIERQTRRATIERNRLEKLPTEQLLLMLNKVCPKRTFTTDATQSELIDAVLEATFQSQLASLQNQLRKAQTKDRLVSRRSERAQLLIAYLDDGF